MRWRLIIKYSYDFNLYYKNYLKVGKNNNRETSMDPLNNNLNFNNPFANPHLNLQDNFMPNNNNAG